ncbi:hypothetical protein IJI76_00920 [Candidatus Saccharibacteria bacterium]|nr:hypothetical protein [Candidatus Saccharibacteria bacterium]
MLQGTTQIINLLEGETRPVEGIVGTHGGTPYFKDENPETTGVPEFQRQLRAEQDRLMAEEKKLRDLRKSKDLKDLYEQARWHTSAKFIDARK